MVLGRTPFVDRNGQHDEEEVALKKKLDELVERVEALENEVKELSTDRVYSSPGFDVLTRSGMERRWHKRASDHDTLIFVDLDELREANSRYGYEGANQRIAAGLAVGDSTIICGRWFSGDEIVFLCNRTDAKGLAQRLQRELTAQGLAATFGIAPVSDDLQASVTRAADLVQAAKARNERGAIYMDPEVNA